MTSAIPGEGFKIASGYLEVVARVEKAEREVDELNRRVDRKLDRAGESGGRSYGGGFLRGLRIRLFRLPSLLGESVAKALSGALKLSALGVAAGAVTSAIGGLASAVASLIPALAELVHVAALAAGSLLLIPAAGAAVIATVATLKVGFKGFGDALKALGSGDAKKLNEALAKLAPNAQRVVKAIQGLQPAFSRLRLGVQQILFTRLAEQVKALGTSWLPVLTAGLGGMALVLNGTIRDAISFLLEASTRLDFSRTFAASATTVHNLSAALRPLLRILTDVTAVGATMLATLTRGAGPAVAAFADRVSAMRASGDLAGMITDGLAALGMFKDLVVDIIGIFRGIFGASGAGGLFSFFDRLNKLVNSVAGQDALKRIFVALADVGIALTPVLLELLKALVPVAEGISKIAVAFSPGLTAIAKALGKALGEDLVPGIAALGPLLSTVAAGLSPIARILADLVVAFAPGLNTFLAALVDGLTALANSGVATAVGKALGDLLAAVAPLLPLLGQVLADMLQQAAGTIGILARALAPLIAVLLPKLVQLWGAWVVAMEPLLPALAQLAQGFVDAFVAHLPQIMALFDRLLPIFTEFAETAVRAMAEGLQVVIPLMPMLIDAAIRLADAFLDLLEIAAPALPLLAELAGNSAGLTIGVFFLLGAMKILEAQFRLIAFVINNVVRPAIDFIVGKIVGATRATETLGHVARESVGKAADVFRTLGSTILGAVGNFGRLLFDAGARLIDGLIDGIMSKFGPLGNVMSSMAQRVRDFWPFSPAKRGPLSGSGDPLLAGRRTVERYAEGAESSLARVGAMVGAGMAAMAARMAPAQPAAVAAGPTSASFGPLRIDLNLDGQVVASHVIDTLHAHPRAVAAATDEGHRQRAFTDSSRKRIGTRR